MALLTAAVGMSVASQRDVTDAATAPSRRSTSATRDDHPPATDSPRFSTRPTPTAEPTGLVVAPGASQTPTPRPTPTPGRSPMRTPSPSASTTRTSPVTYEVRVSPPTPTAGAETAIEITTPDDVEYGRPYVTYVSFGDGKETSCSYTQGSHHAEDCDENLSADGRTQTCYHVYDAPGRYTVRVRGYAGWVRHVEGVVTFDVVAASVIPGPRPRPRGC